MDVVKINSRKKIYGYYPTDVYFMAEEGERLFVVFEALINHKISEGQKLYFMRRVYGDDGEFVTIATPVIVLEKTTYEESGETATNVYDAIYTTIPPQDFLYIKGRDYEWHIGESGSTPEIGDAYFDEVNDYLIVEEPDGPTIHDSVKHFSGLTIGGDVKEYFILQFTKNHNIFQQDIESISGCSLYAFDRFGNKIGTLDGISIPYTGMPFTVTSADTINYEEVETCEKYDVSGNPYNVLIYDYTYAPSNFSRDSIIFESATTSTSSATDFYDIAVYLIENAAYFVPVFNCFYYTYMYSDLRKRCTMWGDPWWAAYEAMNENLPRKEIYRRKGVSDSNLCRYSGYWNVPFVTFSSDDFALSSQTDDSDASYVRRIIEGAIPDVIDMEKAKYVPYVNGESLIPATSLTIDFHFRKREEVPVEESAITVGFDTNYSPYVEGWNINADSAATIWWNGMDYSGETFSAAEMKKFVKESGATADMIGTLGFTDDDVMYRKSKVAKSFVRFSFYTSPDAVEQKLLYYSTSFLDTTSLYGKFMKQFLLRKDVLGSKELSVPLVFFDDNSASARLDTEVVIKNEYNTMASSEGFNLYLFKDDADKVDEGKPYRTIYMKVEFNHAGNGKTIPMIMWPRTKNGEYKALTMGNFMKSLYIPVRIGYVDDRYVYTIPGAYNKDGNIRMILFEPKLDYNVAESNNNDWWEGGEDDEIWEGGRETSYNSNTGYRGYSGGGNGGSSGGGSASSGVFDLYFWHYSLHRYESDIMDRNYNQDNAGYSPRWENTKYDYATLKFWGDGYFGYKLEDWGAYKSASMNPSINVEGSKKTISTSFSENKTEDIHYYYIEIASPDGSERKRITIRQWPVWGQITLSRDTLSVGAGTTTKTVTLTTGKKFESLNVTKKNAGFVSYTPELRETQIKYNTSSTPRELYVYNLTVNVEANDSTASRNGEIKFAINNDRYVVLKIKQLGKTE